jgi:hypothetical protein
MVPSLDEIVPSPVVDNDNDEEREVVEGARTRNATRWYASELLERKAMIRNKKISMMETRSLLCSTVGMMDFHQAAREATTTSISRFVFPPASGEMGCRRVILNHGVAPKHTSTLNTAVLSLRGVL